MVEVLSAAPTDDSSIELAVAEPAAEPPAPLPVVTI